MGIFNEYKNKSNQEILEQMERIGNSGSNNLVGIHILQSILDLRAEELTTKQNSIMISLTRAIYILTVIMAVAAVAAFFRH